MPPTRKDGPSADMLLLAFTLSGDLMPWWRKEGEAVAYADAEGRTVLCYEGLYAFDTNGRTLPARPAAAQAVLKDRKRITGKGI